MVIGMTKQIVYIHGGESYEDYNSFLQRLNTKEIWDLPSPQPFNKWITHFASDLGDEYVVFKPKMPNSENAKYDEWKVWFERHFEYLTNDTILIGCSLGAMFLIKYLIENKTPFSVKALFLMAAAIGEVNSNHKDCEDFLFSLEDTYKILDKVGKIKILHSRDDFLVPYEHAEKLHASIPGSELVTFDDKNHFIVEEFPELVEEIKGLE